MLCLSSTELWLLTTELNYTVAGGRHHITATPLTLIKENYKTTKLNCGLTFMYALTVLLIGFIIIWVSFSKL